MSDEGKQTTEPQCRMKRQALGLPYPKSGCWKCGSIIRPNWQCAEAVADHDRQVELCRVAVECERLGIFEAAAILREEAMKIR